MMTDSEVRALIADVRAMPPRDPEPVAKVLDRKRAAIVAARPARARPWDQREPAQGGA